MVFCQSVGWRRARFFQTTMAGSAGDMKSPPSPSSSRPAATAANGAQLTCARRCSVVVADALFGVVLAGALLLLLSGVADAVADSTNEYASGSFPLNEHGFDAKQTTLWGYRYASSPFVWIPSPSFPNTSQRTRTGSPRTTTLRASSICAGWYDARCSLVGWRAGEACIARLA